MGRSPFRAVWNSEVFLWLVCVEDGWLAYFLDVALLSGVILFLQSDLDLCTANGV